MFNPSRPRENADAQAASTDGRATLYANGRRTCSNEKNCNQKQQGDLNIKKRNHLFFLFLPKAVFEPVYISTAGIDLADLEID
jgi:hypothetical protein